MDKRVSGLPVQYDGDRDIIALPRGKKVITVKVINQGDDAVTIDDVDFVESGECWQLPIIPGHFYTQDIKLAWANEEADQRLSVRILTSEDMDC